MEDAAAVARRVETIECFGNREEREESEHKRRPMDEHVRMLI
jgi:hypothetical protein